MPATLEDLQSRFGDNVYPLYKEIMHEPYMENSNGGYSGVVLHDTTKDLVRCEECGKWVKSVGDHLYVHKITSSEYRDKYGYTKNISLCSKKLSRRLSEIAREKNAIAATKTPEAIELRLKNVKKARKKMAIELKKGRNKASYKNRYGLCDAQIAARLVVVREQSGKDQIYSGDVLKYDANLYSSLKYRYATVEAACKALGLTQSGSTRYEDAFLIGQLRSFVQRHKRIPSTKDFGSKKGMSSLPTYYNHFGSWRRAKMMAGLDQLLNETTQ